MNELKYVIFDFSEVYMIDFNEVKETSIETLRISVDESKTFVKYEIRVIEEDIVVTMLNPESMEEETFTTQAGTYGRPSFWSEDYPELTHPEILSLLATEEWSEPLSIS